MSASKPSSSCSVSPSTRSNHYHYYVPKENYVDKFITPLLEQFKQNPVSGCIGILLGLGQVVLALHTLITWLF